MHSQDLQAEQFLDQIKVGDICKSKDLVTLKTTDSIGDALRLLAEQAITGAPVVDKASDKFLGFVDVLDLTMFVSYLYYENYEKHPHLYNPKELQQRFSLPVSDVINASKRDPFWTVDANESVGFLVNNFLNVGIHRVPVVDNQKVIGIISQSDIIRLIGQNLGKFSASIHQKIGDLGIGLKPVVTVKNDSLLIDAFNALLKNDVSGIAIVDFSTGKLLNNLSASDLKGVTDKNFFKLEAQIHQLLASATYKKPTVQCTAENTLQHVVDQVMRTGVHRVYVVDDQGKPIGVITLTDIMEFFSRPGKPLDI